MSNGVRIAEKNCSAHGTHNKLATLVCSNEAWAVAYGKMIWSLGRNQIARLQRSLTHPPPCVEWSLSVDRLCGGQESGYGEVEQGIFTDACSKQTFPLFRLPPLKQLYLALLDIVRLNTIIK